MSRPSRRPSPARQRRRASGDGRDIEVGFTLVELLVSMTIFTLVISLAYAALIAVTRQTSDSMARADAVDQARIGLAHMDRQIRSGDVLYDPAHEADLGFPMSMRIYTQANAENKCVQWQITGGERRMRSWSSDWPAPGSTKADWSVIARNVVNASGDPADVPFRLQGATSAYSPRSVDVLLRVQSPNAGGRTVDVTTSLTGRNTIYGYDQSVCATIPPA